MRRLACLALLLASATHAQTPGLPRFEDYPAGPAYRGRVAPLVESSSPTARRFRTMTRLALAEGVNFAGRYVVAMWGCGTECMAGHIVDARTGRAVLDLPFYSPFVTVRPDSRLVTVMTPDDAAELFPADDAFSIPIRYQSEYWVFEGDSLRFLGALVASDLDRIRRGGPTPALRTETPGNVLVPLAAGNSWTYASRDGVSTVTYRVAGQRTGMDEDGQPRGGFTVERTSAGPRGESRTIEAWSGGGGLFVEVPGGESRGFDYSFGVPQAEAYYGESVERQTFQVNGDSREAVCYLSGPSEGDPDAGRSRTCFVPRLGMVSREADGETLTLTAHSLR